MLFKALSAAVFGIDAYLVEVEVDVGSGRMGDFNVVGPAGYRREGEPRAHQGGAEELRLRFSRHASRNRQSRSRRHSQGRLGLRSAYGAWILGCQGAFFGKRLDQHVFLGELSLDGSVRSVRGALSAALAAREQGIRSVVVPEANAREAAVVEGIDVFAVSPCRKRWT